MIGRKGSRADFPVSLREKIPCAVPMSTHISVVRLLRCRDLVGSLVDELKCLSQIRVALPQAIVLPHGNSASKDTQTQCRNPYCFISIHWGILHGD